ncbi:hypothetical protein ACFVW1_24965 [Streptomyces olivochromogenes]|uniref:hypothetical protein n=1 Tax=Streptomyces olivochromogenes TaxID=1963 RepID=UPI0036DEBA12
MTFDLAVEAMARNIPRTWRVEPFRRHATLVDETNSKRSLPLLSLASTGIIAPRKEEGGMGRQAPSESTIERYWIAHPGNLVVNPMWLIGGGIGVSAVTGAVSPDYRVYRLGPDLHPEYVHHLLRSAPYRDQYRLYTRADTTFDRRVSKENFHPMPLLVPPLEEQRRIADFLDAETARIDRLSNRYRELEDLAVERAKAVIDKTLSRFSQDFNIPVSAACSTIVDCVNKTAPVSEKATQYRMIRTSNIRNGEVDLTETFSVELPVFMEWNRRGTPRNGDILFTREAPLGQVGMLRTDAPVFLGQRIMLYRADENVIKKELLLFNFLGTHIDRQLRLLGAGSLHEHMRVGDGLKLQIYCPPRAQQDELVAEIEAGRGESLRLAGLAKRQRALLAERGQALITAAVTGQFDVSTASGRNVTDGVSAQP